MNSTPSRCSSIIRLTALPPPPPTPTTFMRAFCAALSSNSKIMEDDTPLQRGVRGYNTKARDYGHCHGGARKEKRKPEALGTMEQYNRPRESGQPFLD